MYETIPLNSFSESHRPNLILDSSVGLSAAFSLLANRCVRPWVRILHSAEEDNLCMYVCVYVCMYVCMYVVSCPVQPRACHWSCVFWRDFSGVRRACWTAGSWRSCLSLEVVSSIPAGSTIIYRFLCGFICVSLCQSIKIKPTNMYVCMYVCMYVSMYVCMCVCVCVCVNHEIVRTKWYWPSESSLTSNPNLPQFSLSTP